MRSRRTLCLITAALLGIGAGRVLHEVGWWLASEPRRDPRALAAWQQIEASPPGQRLEAYADFFEQYGRYHNVLAARAGALESRERWKEALSDRTAIVEVYDRGEEFVTYLSRYDSDWPPPRWQVHEDRARMLERLGRLEQALSEYQRSADFYLEWMGAWSRTPLFTTSMGLGRVQAALGNHELALEHYLAAVEDFPDVDGGAAGLLASLKALEREDEAPELHRQARERAQSRLRDAAGTER